MSKNKHTHIKIPLPKWKWWQTALVLFLLIIAWKSDPNSVLRIVKEVLMKWLLE